MGDSWISGFPDARLTDANGWRENALTTHFHPYPYPDVYTY